MPVGVTTRHDNAGLALLRDKISFCAGRNSDIWTRICKMARRVEDSVLG